MAWKPREKPLTPDEALALARSELAPFWLGAEPMLAGVRGPDGRAAAHPLDKSFDQRAWVILFGDLTDFAGEAVLLYAREWMKRYSQHNLSVMLVVRAAYSFLSSVKALPPFLGKTVEAFPVVLDYEGLIAEAFGVKSNLWPAVKVLNQRKVMFDHAGPNWADGVEKEIQSYLRIKDPGLPLAPSFVPPGFSPKASTCAELGLRARSPIFRLDGKIAQEQDRVVMQSASATIRFRSPAPRVSIVAQSMLLSTGEPGRIRIELDGGPIFDAVAGADLSFGDDGGSELKLTEGRLYHALQVLPAQSREITLRCPDADRLPIAIHGVRFTN